ncbi:L,D-transpeptidase family protein [Candidatus Clostridium stratigraminis]|uniref:Peptidoglycan binding domain-containing protein n=1 Tax=Candidatus Clostridium stratigraminis TaxID=3381661 RepID=A0ABW8T120_9CLOT
MEKEKQEPKPRKILLVILIPLCSLLIIYFGITLYFINHYYYGSSINCINVSGKTVEEVKSEMSSKLQDFTLELKERGGAKEVISAVDIDLGYTSEEEFKKLKDKQSAFKWITAFSNKKANEITVGVTFDRELLKKQLDKLNCLNNSNIVEPKNPSFKYTDSGYIIVPETLGNKINKDVLYTEVEKVISKEGTYLDLEAINCYVNPQYTSKSEKVIETKNILNKYAASKITYNIGDKNEIVDGTIINKWLSVDENFTVSLDEVKAKSYLTGLLNKYNTIGKTRNFPTTSGKTIKISGGDYGYAINTVAETQDFIAAIKEGKILTKEPKYSQTTFSAITSDIGNTYVEIDMTNQHLWFYKKGSLMAQGDIVTGNVNAGHKTPSGIYRLKYKQKGAVLRGPDYAAPVTYWMPFNGGIGLHDASWRSRFGGNIYKTDGSHGCVNLPFSLAKTIFENIDPGTPVVCFY